VGGSNLLKKQDIVEAVKAAKAASKKRNFVQSMDFTVNFTGIDFKKQENRIDVEVSMPHAAGKTEAKVLVFVKDKNFFLQIKDKADKIIMADEIPSIKKKQLDELINEYSVFLAEGPAMLVVGRYLGQQLAPRGRMPKPIEASEASFKNAVSRFGGTIRVTNKKGKNMPVVHIKVGTEKSDENNITDNIEAIYDALVANLPNKEHSIKSMYVKLTMGKPAKVGEKAAPEKAGKKEAGKKEAGKKEAGEKEAGEKEAGEKEAGEKEAGEKETAQKETADKPAAGEKKVEKKEPEEKPEGAGEAKGKPAEGKKETPEEEAKPEGRPEGGN
jgi:large subunit ribosomal protein L1